MAKSISPNNRSGVFAAIRELTGDYAFDEEGQVIEHPYLIPNPTPSSSAGVTRPFAAEIESLRIALQRLQHAFSCVDSIEEQLLLLSAINLTTASIARLVRSQDCLIANNPIEFNRETKAALDVVMKEWSRT